MKEIQILVPRDASFTRSFLNIDDLGDVLSVLGLCVDSSDENLADNEITLMCRYLAKQEQVKVIVKFI